MPSFISVKMPSNHKQIQRDFALFPKRSAKEYARAVQLSTERYRDFTKSMRPVSKKTTGYSAKGIPLDEGALRRSIKKKRLSKFAAGITVGGDAQSYGAHVHEGTKKMPARPFFKWSLELGAMKIIDRIFLQASKRVIGK